MQFLFWLLTLNSVVNPWIYLVFNNNLVESLKRLFCPSRLEERRRRLSKPKRSKKGQDRQNERKSRSVSPAHRLVSKIWLRPFKHIDFLLLFSEVWLWPPPTWPRLEDFRDCRETHRCLHESLVPVPKVIEATTHKKLSN